MHRTILPIMVGGVMILAAGASLALDPVEMSTKTKGATTVEWDSSFEDLNYDCNPITLTDGDLQIQVLSGDALFQTFIGKKHTFTPKSNKNHVKVEGNLTTGDTAQVEICSLHLDAQRQVYIGNVHLKWRGEIDRDGLLGREATADFGVNVHLERPEINGNCECVD